MVSRPQEVSTDSEEILHDTVNRREPLELSGRREPPHLALPLTRRLVGEALLRKSKLAPSAPTRRFVTDRSRTTLVDQARSFD